MFIIFMLSGEVRVYFCTSFLSFELSDKGCEKGFALPKFDRKTFSSYSSSALYVSVPGYYFSNILIFYTKIPFISKVSGWNFWPNLTSSKQTA